MYKIFTIFITFLLAVPIVVSTNKIESSDEDLDTITIKIAQYPRYAGCDQIFDYIFNYNWNSNGKNYTFKIKELTLEETVGGGEMPLNVENYDMLLVGASFDSFYKNGLDNNLLENIRTFVSEGGGYQSVCAGTIFSTQGYEHPNRLYKKYMNNNVLKIADVYLNLDMLGESQYVFKGGLGSHAITMEDRVVRNNSNPIFKNYPYDIVNISYSGGPGLYSANSSDPIYGDVTPLLIINEELMETKPLHWFVKGILPGWIPIKKVKTDMKGQYAAVASTYGDGKVVVFNCHPEIAPVINGTIEEYLGEPCGYGFMPKTIFPIRVVFDWHGTRLNISHNWWMHRRSAAWIAGVPDEDLPPYNELATFINKPMSGLGLHEFYFEDEGIIYGHGNANEVSNIDKPSVELARQIVEWVGMTVVAGNITVQGYAENSKIMEFYMDDVLQYTDTERPFKWKLNNGNFSGVHTLEARSYDEYVNYAYDSSEFFFINI